MLLSVPVYVMVTLIVGDINPTVELVLFFWLVLELLCVVVGWSDLRLVEGVADTVMVSASDTEAVASDVCDALRVRDMVWDSLCDMLGNAEVEELTLRDIVPLSVTETTSEIVRTGGLVDDGVTTRLLL